MKWILGLLLIFCLVGVASGAVSRYNLTDGDYTIHIFNGTGTTTWAVPKNVTSAQYLVVAGGGGGGNYQAGGGGAGGLLSGTTTNISRGGIYTVIVGDGGAGGAGSGNSGSNGQNSTFSNITAVGGGGGGGNTGVGKYGGSGGGSYNSNSNIGLGISGQGFSGAYGTNGVGWAGGGGGSSQIGFNGSTSPNGYGGNGTSSSITGTLVYYAGGGGGGRSYGSTAALGGTGGGGSGGGYSGLPPTGGIDELGGGGGGGGVAQSADGGSGVVIIRYNITPPSIADFIANDTETETTLPVLFTDLSTGTTGWSWFFGDEPYTQSWIQQNASSGWEARFGLATTTLHDGSIVVMGGSINPPGYIYSNDTWRSTDKGVTWTLQNASSGWGKRTNAAATTSSSGDIILVGGYDADVGSMNDVWRSTDNGVTWTCINTSAGWAGRTTHSIVTTTDGTLVIPGGFIGYAWSNDVWSSSDSGVTWTQVNSSPGWVGRAYPVTVALPDGSIVVMGGNEAGPVYHNDVWRSTDKGITWTQQTASAAWDARSWHTGVAMPDNSILVIGGYNSGGDQNNVWRSTDTGKTWSPVTSIGWTWKYDSSSTVLPDGSVILLSGNLQNDTWRMQPVGSSTQSPVHNYSNVGYYNVSLRAYNTGGWDTEIKNVYINVSPFSVDKPITNFIVNNTTGVAGMVAQFTDLSTATKGINAWNWSFGDGNFSNSQNPTHTYAYNGQYSVTLISQSFTMSNFTTKLGYINVGITVPVSPNFVGTPIYSAVNPMTVTFTDQSVCLPICNQWAWDFNNDGNFDNTAQNPTWTYTSPGNYSVRLVVGNSLNTGTFTRLKYITVGPVFVPPTIPVPTAILPGGINTTFQFKSNAAVDLQNSTFLKYWLQNFTSTGNFSVTGFAIGLMQPLLNVFSFWIYLIIWGLYLFAVWIRTQDVTLPLIIGILSMGTFGLLFPKEALPVIIIMFVVCGAIIITKLMKDSI